MTITLPTGKKIFFASDFHLGVPNAEQSLARERRIIRWLESVKPEAHSVYLMGDIFDFWFEYKHTIPKGFIRLQGKLAEFTDAGIRVIFFTGNHDMWMFDYFKKELDITIHRDPVLLHVNNQKILIGHGDGLGPGDKTYKILKWFFNSKFCQWLFGWIHPNIGMGIAHFWSRRSRISNVKREEQFNEENEFLLAYCKNIERNDHHDFYIFGHRHLPLDLNVLGTSRYINLGEWVNFNTYAEYDGKNVQLKTFND